MRRTPSLICAGSIAAFIAAAAASRTSARAATVYWDTNGSTSGSGGGASPVGDWTSSSTVWSSSSLGLGVNPSSWVAGDTAVFSAGSNATGSYTINVVGNHAIGGLIFEDGAARLSGGTLTLAPTVFSAVDLFVNSGVSARVDSVLAGDFGINKTGFGSLRLGGVNTFTGPVTVSAGTLSATSASAFGTGTTPITVTGNSTRGTGGGQLVLGNVTLTRPLFVTGLGPGGDASALFLSGDNNLSSLTTGGTATTRMSASGGINTIDFFVGGAGQNSQFNGSGHWVINNIAISGQANSLLQKVGAGGMIILEGDNLIENELRVNTGSLRMSSGQNVPILSTENNAAVLELRTDKASTFVDTRLIVRNGGIVFADRAVGSTQHLLNQTVAFSDTSFVVNNVTGTFTGRNGYNISLGGAGGPSGIIPFATGNIINISNTLNGRLTFDGSVSFTDTTSRVYTFGGNGDTRITGNILGTGGVHSIAKTGTGVLSVGGDASTNNGGISVNQGTLAANRLTGAGNGVINLGATTVSGSFNYLGDAITGDGETSGKVFNLTSTTANAIIRANQTGSALTLTSNLGAGGGGIKNLVLGGTSMADNTISGLIQDNGGANRTNLVKTGPGTWVYSPEAANYAVGGTYDTTAASGTSTNLLPVTDTAGLVLGQSVSGTNIPAGAVITAIDPGSNTIRISTNIGTSVTSGTVLTFGAVASFTGSVTVAGGTLKMKPTVLPAAGNGSNLVNNTAGTVTFNADTTTGNGYAGGTFEYVGFNDGASTESLGAVTSTAGAGTVKLTPTGALGTVALTFQSLTAPAAGASLNFQVPAGGTVILANATAGFQSPRAYYNGADFVFSTGNLGVTMRGISYGSDANTNTVGPGLSLTGSSHNLITTTSGAAGVVTQAGAASINSLKLLGGTTLNANGAVTIQTAANSAGGILVTGGTVTIQGGNGVTTNGTGDLVVRVDGASDQLNFGAAILSTTTGGLTKNGAGKLVLQGGNIAYTGTTTINEGMIQLSGSGRLGGTVSNTTNNLVVRQGATLDLNGVSNIIGVGAFNGAGTVTNSVVTPVTFTIGNGNQNGVFSGLISGNIALIKAGSGLTMSLTGLNTYTGATQITGGTLVVNNLADGGQPSSIGQSSNAASNLVLNGATLLYQGANAQTFQETNTPSVSTDRLFTLAANAVIDSSGSFGNNVLAGAGANHATLLFSNTGAIAHTGASSRTLTLQGSSLGDNEMRPQLTNPVGLTLSLTKAGAGLWILNPATPNTYTGVTTISGGALQATDGAGVPTTSGITLNGGVFQSVSGLFTRSVGTGAGQIQWGTNAAGGFSAANTRLTVNLGGSAVPLTWGPGSIGNGTGTLILSSTSAVADVNFVNPIDLNGATRTIQVDDNPNTFMDFATLSGVISGAGGINKTNGGVLYLPAANTYTGNTAVNNGTIVIQSFGGTGMASSSLGQAGGTLSVGTGGTTGVVNYTGEGETSDRAIILAGTTGGAVIEANGSGALILSNITVSDPLPGTPHTKTLTLRGFNSDANEITAKLENGAPDDILAVSKTDNGTWILSGANTYTGLTTVGAGSLGIGNDGALSQGQVTVTNASIFAAGADRTITNNVVLFTGNATEAVFGDFSLTLGLGPSTAVHFGNGGTTTLTNTIVPGKALTINSNVTMSPLETSTSVANRTLALNGSGTTIINGQVQDQQVGGRVTNLTYSGTGVLVLNGSNSSAGGYTGITNAAGGALQAVDGVGLPSASLLTLGGGVFQTSTGSITRTLGSGAGQVQWTTSGGFSAVGQDLTVDFPGTAPLVWGGGTVGASGSPATVGFISGTNSLIFGSTTSDAQTVIVDSLDLNNTDAAINRTFIVNDNPATNADVTRVTGAITRSGAGSVGYVKNGAGTLIFEASAMTNSNAFGGTIQVSAGTLVLNASPAVGAGGALTMVPSATGSNLVLGAGVSILRAGNFTLSQATQPGNATVTGGPGSSIILNAATGLATRVFSINDNPLTVDDLVISVPLLNGGGGAGRVTFQKEGAGQLVLSGDNAWNGPTILFKGTTVIDYGASALEKLVDNTSLETRGGHLILRGNASGPVREVVGNLSPGSSNIGQQNATPNLVPVGAVGDTFGSLTGTAAPNGGLSNITLQPVNNQPLQFEFRGFVRSPGGGMALLSSTGPTGTFHTGQSGDVDNGRLLATNVLLDGRWIARAAASDQIVRHFGVLQTDTSAWGSTETYEVDAAISPGSTLGTNNLPGVIFSSAANTNLQINNLTKSLTLNSGAILVAPESTASLVEITGGKLMTDLNYRSAAGTDLQIQNFSSGLLRITANVGINSAPLGNSQFITIAGNGPGTGLVELAGKSTSVLTYNGGTILRGAVKIIGGATLRVSGGDALSDYQAIDLGTAGNVGGNLQLNGSAETIGGFLNVNTAQGVTAGSVDLGVGGALTLNQNLAGAFAGAIIGSGSFIKQGNATFTSNGSALTFDGSVQVTGGLLDLTGNLTDGLIGNVTSVLLRGGEINAQHDSGGLIAINKLPDMATVTLDGTFNLGLRVTSNTSGRSESVQAINVASGANTITVNAANATSQLTLRATSPTNGLVRTGQGTLLIKGDGLGGGVGGSLNNSARIMINSGASSLGLIGGTGATLTTHPILPWAIGSTADPVAAIVGDSFVTYGPNGLRPLAPTEYSSNFATAGATDNFSTSTTQAGLTGKTINSLRLDNVAGPVSVDGTGILTIASGAILVSAGTTTNAASIGTNPPGASFFRIDPGASKELVIHVTSSNAAPAGAVLTIGSQITDNNIGDGVVSVTKSGTGTLVLTNTNNFSGGLTINQGTVQYDVLGAPMLGDQNGPIRLAGGTLRYTGTGNSPLTTHPIVLSGPSSYYTPTGTGAAGNALNRGSTIDVSTAGSTVTINGPTGTGGLVKFGAGNLVVQSAATYGGTTAVLQGNATFHSITGGPQITDFSPGLFIVPENFAGIPVPNNVVVNVTNDLRVNQLMVGGVFTTASTLTGAGSLFVGDANNHPAVYIGNGGGDSFLIIGYHDEGAGNLASGGLPPNETSGLVNFSQASSVDINVSRIYIGQHKGAGSGIVDGDLTLSSRFGAQNKVTAGVMLVGNSPGPNSTAAGGNTAIVNLGSNNANTEINVDSLIIGGQNSNGQVVLGFEGNLKLRDRSGEGGANLFIGDNDDLTETTQSPNDNKLDTTSGTIDARLNLLVIGRHGGNTTTTAIVGGGAGALLFDDGVVEASTVRLALVSQRGVTTAATISNQQTQAEITQDGGAFLFGHLSKGEGKVTYNWNAGTIGPASSVTNAVNENVIIVSKADDGNPHFLSVPAGQTMTFKANAGFTGNGDVTKVGDGTLIMESSTPGNDYGGDTFVNQGLLLANNTAFSATGSGRVQVGANGILGGSGIIGNEVRVLGGTVPGTPGGKLIVGGAAGQIGELRVTGVGNLLLDADSVLEIEIMTNTGTGTPMTDLLEINGILLLDSAEFGDNPDGDPFTTAELRITDLNPRKLNEGDTITFLTTFGGWDGINLFKINGQLVTDYHDFYRADYSNPDSTIFYINGYGFRLDYDGGFSGNDVMLIAVPEPGALASLVGGLGMLLGLQRFRRWSAKGKS